MPDPQVVDNGDGTVTLSQEDLAALRTPQPNPATEALRRENIALRAGVDLENPNTKFLLNGWPDGAEFTPEAVKAAAEGLGLLAGQEQAPETPAPTIPVEEQGQTAVRAALQPNSTPAVAEQEVHPTLEAWRAHRQVIDTGGSEEDAMAVAVNTIVRRAHAGTAKQLIIPGGANEGEAVDSIVARKGHLDPRTLTMGSLSYTDRNAQGQPNLAKVGGPRA